MASRQGAQVTQRLAMPRAAALQAQGTTGELLRTWNTYVEQQLSSGGLRTTRAVRDPLLPSRTVERFQALHRGVPIWVARSFATRKAASRAPSSGRRSRTWRWRHGRWSPRTPRHDGR